MTSLAAAGYHTAEYNSFLSLSDAWVSLEDQINCLESYAAKQQSEWHMAKSNVVSMSKTRINKSNAMEQTVWHGCPTCNPWTACSPRGKHEVKEISIAHHNH